jgi:hypothetical protein
MIREFHNLHTLLTPLAIRVHLAQQVFRGVKCNSVLPNISNLGSVSTNLGKLSVDDANDFLGLRGTSPTSFREVGVPDKRPS